MRETVSLLFLFSDELISPVTMNKIGVTDRCYFRRVIILIYSRNSRYLDDIDFNRAFRYTLRVVLPKNTTDKHGDL